MPNEKGEYERVQAEIAEHQGVEDQLSDGIPPVVFFPNRVDIEVTSQCINDCPNCLNLKPDQTGSLPNYEQILGGIDNAEGYAPDDAVSEIMITGGEPLMRRGLPKLFSLLEERGVASSLSTTGYDPYNQLGKVIKKCIGIGIPIDGPTAEINGIWRGRGLNDGGLSVAVDALKKIRRLSPGTEIRIRTLVHPGNIQNIHEIPKFLIDSGIDISDNTRWIIYEQYIRSRSDHDGLTILEASRTIENSDLGTEEFTSGVAEAGSKFSAMTIKTLAEVAFKYFVINPYGDCRVVAPITTDVKSKDFGRVGEYPIGNIIESPADVVINFNTLDANTIAHLSAGAYSHFYEGAEEDAGRQFDWF